MRDRCAFCGARIKQQPVDGTDPDAVDGSWYEIYHCENGHSGRLEWDSDTGTETSGAVAEHQKVIV